MNVATLFRFKWAAISRSNSGADSQDKAVVPFDSKHSSQISSGFRALDNR